MSIFGKFFGKKEKESLDKGLEKTKDSIFGKISKAVIGKSTVDEDVLDELEDILIAADVGVSTTLKIIDRLEERVKKDKYLNTNQLNNILYEEIAGLLAENKSTQVQDFMLPESIKPYVILVVGVNGVGKTTTIGKIASQFAQRGKSVVLGAADTFRAAAVDQLRLWGERVGVPVISLGMNTDPASVAFETVKKGVEVNADVIIIDTAGRLHTKVNLMNELGKIRRVIQKVIPEAPHEVMLVLDGSTGQNAVIQAREFTKATEVSSLAITKLDGTAKGGVVIGISDEFKIPVKYIGVGEKVEDLQLFNNQAFVSSLFSKG
ncbi:signal recognition particle-docking protein FtsY [Chondrinema litorale]|uniref:signal recognition particle-docking protein FtsY n=1 Tax=Chondrinema litorale TaxID=2994555 RepID=UPI00254424A0|nr:signal recognition particle-docking protein FtsY [Chondrinema litorale]UZR93703.1 signal recognition particle-docking protein FtsY [Chondrinema litorale]